MKEFWEEKYSNSEYIYGLKPNEFLLSKLKDFKSGSILFPCDGEGRNSVYFANQGFDVVAFDFSQNAKAKALNLAKNFNVRVDYFLADWKDFFTLERFDFVAIAFAHFKKDERQEFHKKMMDLLKPDGLLIAEYFSKKQINKNSGGPKDLNILYDISELKKDFSEYTILELYEIEIDLNEGILHQGKADIVRVVVKK